MLIRAVTGKSQDNDAPGPRRRVVRQEPLYARRERGTWLFGRDKPFSCKLLNPIGRRDRFVAGSGPRAPQSSHRPVHMCRLGRLGKIVSLRRIFGLKDWGDSTENVVTAFVNVGTRASKSAGKSS